MLKKHPQSSLFILAIVWLVGALSDRFWFALDRSVPAWDQAEYLNGAMNYWQALQQPHWLESEWWRSFWQVSTKVPPLTFIVAAFIQQIFGTGIEQATLVNLVFSAILLTSVYGLGVELFSAQVGLWAAGLCQLIPALYRLRLDFLLDYPLAAVVTLSFWCLTVWRVRGERREDRCAINSSFIIPLRGSKLHHSSFQGWLWAAGFGVSFGLALLVKQTALFFLLTPVLWVGVEAIRSRSWQRIFQLIVGLLLSLAVFGPWYRTNWLLILTGGKRATVDSALKEGDPALNTLGAWTYYWQELPEQVSWLLLIVPIVGLLIYWRRSAKPLERRDISRSYHSPLKWLAIFWVGSYLLCSLNINKDYRYVLPYLPTVSLFLAYGLTRWYGRWGKRIRWGTIGLAVMLMFLNLFPVLPNSIASALSPNAQHYAYLGQKFPHAEVIDSIIQAAPYVSSNLGVLPSTPEINQHNLNYYGALQNFQVYARQVGTQKKQIYQDARSLDWFLTKTGTQGSVPPAQADMVQTIERSPDFYLHQNWNLPDRSTLKLYHRRTPQVQVQPVAGTVGAGFTDLSKFPTSILSNPPVQKPEGKITLSRVIVPPQAPPGKPVPVTYEWVGSWEQLQPGLVLLTWQNQFSSNPRDRWLHDRGIAMGTIQNSPVGAHSSAPLPTPSSPLATYHVTEKTSMLPPANLPAGTYSLAATYLNRKTGETYPISVPPVTLKIDPAVRATPAPELDLLTQLRSLASALPQGIKALDRVFAEVGRINQYDPIQDYLVQAQLAIEYRLQKEPQNLEWAYTLGLANVLQQKVAGAIAAFERVTQLDSQNPYAYAYLAFVHLYNWNGAAASSALKPALALEPNLPELQALSAIAALMQGNLIQTWHYVSLFQQSSQ